MKLHHLDIFNRFFVKDNIVFLLPNLNEEFNFSKSSNYPLTKIVDGNYYNDITYASDLIIIDKAFIEDVRNSELYLIFTATPKEYFLNNPLNYIDMWDPKLSLKDLIFLGWTINSGTDTAVEDGIFPILIIYDDYQNIAGININDLNALNNWGLIKNKFYLENYIRKNNTAVKHILDNDKELITELEINWFPNAIYCDYYTYLKLCNLIKIL